MGCGGSSATLTTAGYERLRRATETYREELVLRLGAEVGLKPAEMINLEPGHITQRTHRGTDLYFLAVPTDGREAYLPTDVEHEIRKYVSANRIDETDRVFPVTTRRLQMLVSTIGDRAAERTGRDALAGVSTRDLRRYFARTLLEDGVHPCVVMQVGGWDRIESLAPLLDAPAEDDVLAALAPEDHEDGPGDRGAEPPAPRPSAAVEPVVEAVQAVGAGLSAVNTRTEVEQTVCDRITGSGRYRFAWIESDETDARESLAATAGVDEASLEPVRQSLDAEFGARACRERAVETTANITAPSDLGGESIAAIPIVHDETVYGVLYLALEGSVSDHERGVLLTLGRHVGQAITAAERRKLLLADTVVQLEFRCEDDNDLLVRLSGDLDCTIHLRGVVPIEDQSLLCFLTVQGATTEATFDELMAVETVENVRLIRDRGEESLVEIALSAGSVITTLTAYDGTVSRFVAEAGVASFVSEFSNETRLRDVMSDLTDVYPETELVSKQEVERPARSTTDFRASLATHLTDKQQSVLRAAYLAGYFEWPRGSTAEDLADSIDVSSPTLHQHLRTAQQKLLTSFFDDEDDDVRSTLDH